MSPTVTVETVPATCLVADVCRLLAMSRTQFFQKRDRLQQLGILVEQMPRLDRKLRFQGAPIAQFLSADGQAAQTRRLLRSA